MRKEILIALGFVLLCACSKKPEPTPTEKTTPERYTVEICSERDEFYANGKIAVLITPQARSPKYKIVENHFEIWKDNQWKEWQDPILPADGTSISDEEIETTKFLIYTLNAFQADHDQQFRIVFTLRDKEGDVTIAAQPSVLLAGTPSLEPLDHTEFLKLYPYRKYAQGNIFTQDRSVDPDNAPVLVSREACMVVSGFPASRILNVACEVIDRSACPVTDYKAFLPRTSESLKARKFVYGYDNGPLFDEEIVSGDLVAELMEELLASADAELIPIPICLKPGEFFSEDLEVERYGYRFLDEEGDRVYQFTQSVQNSGIDFVIMENGDDTAHVFIPTSFQLER